MDIVGAGPFQIIDSNLAKQDNPPKGLQWPTQELIKYGVFLAFFSAARNACLEMDFNSWPFFRRLSIFIQTKNPNQCRIFHKKMMAEHSSTGDLIAGLKTTIHKFQEWQEHYESSLLNLKACLSRERGQAQKQLTNNELPIKQRIIPNHKNSALTDDLKKCQDLLPTDTGYRDDQKDQIINSEHYSFGYRQIRKHFDSSLTQDPNVAEDLSLFNSRLRNPAQKTPAKAFGNKQIQLMDCHNHFLGYLAQLKNLIAGAQDY